MTVFHNDDRWDTQQRRVRDGRIVRYDKTAATPSMRHIDYGLGVFTQPAFAGRADDEAVRSRRRLPGRCSPTGELAGYEVRERFYEIGSPAGLEETRALPGSAREQASMSYARQHLDETGADHRRARRRRDRADGRRCWPSVRARGGRLFFLGVGGSAGNCSHAVNDFRKIAGIEAYAPTDNVSELTARTNDEGWATVFVDMAEGSRLHARKTRVFVFSVGGGNLEKNISPNLVRALQLRARRSARRSSASSAATAATPRRSPTPACIVPTVNPENDHAALRGVPGRGLAPAGVASGAQGGADEVGIDRGDVAAPSSSTATA